MTSALPTYISLIFGLTTAATLLAFVWAVKNANAEKVRKQAGKIGIGLFAWLILQAVLSLNNQYNSDPDTFPPVIMLTGIFPAVFAILVVFLTRKGRQFTDSLPLKQLTYLNTVRIPVELVLYGLFLYQSVPELMTFEGRNFDILAGITAPFVAYFGLTKTKMSRQTLLIWNVICLGLLLNIVVNALLSAPSLIQQFAFDQPNTAVLNFPFSWLPTFIVPIVLFGHLASIRQLLQWKTD